MSNSTPTEDLERIHREIDGCTVCASVVRPFEKPIGLVRGGVSEIVIVGQEPGRAELAAQKAFAGMSGSKLDEWLRACGFSEQDPRATIYLTSVLKCLCPAPEFFSLMKRNCAGFLATQLSIINPKMIITLGEKAYETIQFTGMAFGSALCRSFDTADYLLFGKYGGGHFTHVPWPHPSGRNRWHNDPANRVRLEASFDYIKSFLRGLE